MANEINDSAGRTAVVTCEMCDFFRGLKEEGQDAVTLIFGWGGPDA